ncbi:MAG: lipoate--protein ligase [Isosphaeraceae bacterium]|jgi:lipoate-protein ligase A|nr:MAG: lipoate--protein ligase [Isosphaeraceae bacterium]
MFPIRILEPQSADGPWNMGLDLALLDAVDADPSFVVLRFYQWAEPTLSLGYFQRYAEAAQDPRWNHVPLIRRPTGGGAIWHDGDLTYAVIVPRSHPATAHPRQLYRSVHTVWEAELRRWGVPVRRRGDAPPHTPQPPSKPFLCFLDHDPDDLVCGGHKIVGSAQRRRPRAVLQHGSILVRTSERTPELIGLDRLHGSIEPTALARGMAERLITAWGLNDRLTTTTNPSFNLTPQEQLGARRYARETFSMPAWTHRR